jgi:hypothetical protein
LPAHDADSIDEDVDQVTLMLLTLEGLKGEIAQRRQLRETRPEDMAEAEEFKVR